MRNFSLVLGKSDLKILRLLAYLCWGGAIFFALLMLVFFVIGFPVPFLEGAGLKVKSLRRPFEIGFVLFLAGIALHPERKGILAALKEKTEGLACKPWAIWALAGIYFLFFLGQQVSKYFALDMNFIPFLFYDYMLWYFDQGRFCYTGLLHGYYHVNLILWALYPVWKLFQNSWVLLVAHPLIGASAVIPFYFWSRERLGSAVGALVTGFVYLNFRYLQNVLLVNFAVEIFYPLFIFSAVYFASQKKETLYYLSLLLGLLVKEDSVIYFGALGGFYLLCRGQRLRGLWTLLLALGYAGWAIKVFIPWSGSTILKGSLANYKELGSSPGGIVTGLLANPVMFIRELFLPVEKTETLLKLVSKLLFLPLFSPWIFLMLAAIYPLFFRSVPGALFTELSLFYSAAVLPFLFLAFADGWRRVSNWKFIPYQPVLKWVIAGLLIFLNGMNLRPTHFDGEDLKTLGLAKSLPREKIIVTQGHLLPYLGYREWNFYWASPFGASPRTKEKYLNPDYYFFDLEANAYPYSPDELVEQVNELKKDTRYTIRYEDRRRLLLERAG